MNNRQLDQLLLNGEMPAAEEQINKPSVADIDRAKERLRALDDLKRHKGYQMLIESLRFEAQHCLGCMDKASDPTSFTKFASNYFSLTMACGYVDNEMARLRSLLQAHT